MKKAFSLLAFIMLITSCEQEYVPKPRGYFRIDFPEKKYVDYEGKCPFSFELPAYSKIELIRSESFDSCWFNVAFPRHKAKLHFTYLPIHNNLQSYLEDSYTFAFKHEMKANAISRTQYYSPDSRVSGLVYDIKGNVASNLQFYATDSADHFIRGALYFEVRPNQDSLAPVVDFIKADVIHLLETLDW